MVVVDSRRVCAIRMELDKFNLLFFINVYMPYEGSDILTAIFTDQLATVENIINDHLHCHVIVGGDCIVDFNRFWTHTALLQNFCESNCL